jgi:hypothetical protein
VRVGRAPIDEEAIRLLEQHNPDIEFDWTRILKDPPPDPAARRERDPRDRDRRDRREARPPQRARPVEPAPVAPAPSPAVIHARTAEAAEERAAAHADVVLAQHAEVAGPSLPAASDPTSETTSAVTLEGSSFVSEESLAVEHREPLAADHGEYLEYAAASGHLDGAERETPAEPREPEIASAAAVRLGAEGLVRLRARYAEIMARITEKPMDEPAREELKTQAERLNPDAWVTPDEVAAALEQYETVFESLRTVVGHYPSRRRRR